MSWFGRKHAPAQREETPKMTPSLPPLAPAPAAKPLRTTEDELRRTEQKHTKRLKKADSVLGMLDDFEAMDVVLRVVIPQSSRRRHT